MKIDEKPSNDAKKPAIKQLPVINVGNLTGESAKAYWLRSLDALYYNTLKEIHDEVKRLEWITLFATNDYAPACCDLGIYYLSDTKKGSASKKSDNTSYEQAIEWFEKASQLRDNTANRALIILKDKITK